MTDEKFVFIEDCKDKKRTARGAFNKRTHCGKGGAVKFPSDYLTTKEKKAMNGECKSYRMNDPMKWDEFKKMPEDLQIAYIKAIRQQFNAPDTEITKMMGVTHSWATKYFKKLGLALGKNHKRGHFEKDAWTRWVNGVPQVTCYDETDEATAEEPTEFMTEEVKEYVEQDIQATQAMADILRPEIKMHGGHISITGMTSDLMRCVYDIIGERKVYMTFHWEVDEKED